MTITNSANTGGAQIERAGWLRRIGTGAFGAGTLGMLGLLGGFFVPILVLCRIAAGQVTNTGMDGGIFPFLSEALDLFIGLLYGLAQGAVGIAAGLLLGFLAGAIGPKAAAQKRMVIATGVVLLVSLISAFRLSAEAVRPAPASTPVPISSAPAAFGANLAGQP